MKSELKNKAIELRKKGNTYSEILKIIPVSKSTLSLWLREVGIARKEEQAFTEKKRLAAKRGGLARKNQRIKIYNEITGLAEKEIGKMTKRELWLVGVALYWAEGSKEKEYSPGSGVKFSNSDPKMISLFLLWLTKACGIPNGHVFFELYIHDNYRKEVSRFVKYWSDTLGISRDQIDKVYFKKGNIRSKRVNQGQLYNGLVRVKVSKSSFLNRQITGWVRGIVKYWGIV